MRLELPSGGWADLRDPDEVTFGERKAMEKSSIRSVFADKSTEQGADLLFITDYERLKAFVAAWSFDAPLPRDDIKGLDNLSPKDVDKMRRECQELSKQIYLDVDPKPDERSPTGPSGASDGRSRADQSTNGSSSLPSGASID